MKYILIKEDIFDKDKILLVKKGEVCQFISEAEENGYIFVLRLKTHSVAKIPYARGFVQFISEKASEELKIALDEELATGLDYD